MHVHFTWDEGKRRINRTRHGLDFADAPDVFAGPTLTLEDDRFDYPERRFMTIGFLRDTAVSLIHTESSDHIHVISFRKATRREEALIFEALRD
jgi:uncharacterized DUF497 family protein